MTMVVAELEKTLSSFPVVDSVVSLLDGVVEKLSALKRKVSFLFHTATLPQTLKKKNVTLLGMLTIYCSDYGHHNVNLYHRLFANDETIVSQQLHTQM